MPRVLASTSGHTSQRPPTIPLSSTLTNMEVVRSTPPQLSSGREWMADITEYDLDEPDVQIEVERCLREIYLAMLGTFSDFVLAAPDILWELR